MQLKNRLKELRARDGLNQTELAKLAGVSRQTISLLERDESHPIHYHCSENISKFSTKQSNRYFA